MTSEATIPALDVATATQAVYDAIQEEQHWREQLAINKASIVELKLKIAAMKKESEEKIKGVRDHINTHINVRLREVKKRQIAALHVAGGGQEPNKKRRRVEPMAVIEDLDDYLEEYEEETIDMSTE